MTGRAIRGLLVLLAVLAGPLLSAAPAARAAEEVRAAPHDGYGRMVFDFNGPVDYSTEIAAGALIVQFSRPVKADPRRVARPLRDYVSGVRIADDRKTLTFPLKGPFKADTFTLGSAVVIDLRPSTGRAAQAAQTPDAAAAPEVPVRAAAHPGYHRVVFDWPQPVGYQVRRNGAGLTLTFQRPATVDVAGLQRRLPKTLRKVSATTTADGLTVSLPVPEGGRARHFVSGTKVVVDLLLPDAAAERQVAEQDASPAPSAPTPPPGAAPPDDAAEAQKPSAPAAPVAAKAPAPDAGPDAGPDPSAAAAALADALREQLQGPAPDQAQPDVASPGAGGVADAEAAPPAPAAAQEEGRVRARVVSLSFSWDTPTAAAVFRRAGYLWVVFDNHQEVDLKLLRRMGGNVVHHVEQRPSNSATIVRLIVEPGYNPSLRREGLLWILDLMRQPYRPAKPIAVQPQPRSPVGPRLYLPVAEGGRAMVLQDPGVGDRFIAVPVMPLGHGVYPGHAYPDADLPVTVQGVLVEPHSERIVVNSTRTGVDVTADGGLILSPDIEEMKAIASIGTQTNLTRVLDIESWMRGASEDFPAQKKLLQRAVASAPPGRRHNARLDLARFFFAHGYEAEALGILRVMAADRPETVNTGAFRALRGAASYLMGRYDQAVVDFNHPSLQGVEEASFWRALAQSQLGDAELQALTIRDFGGVLGSYPRWVRVPLALSAARATVAAADDLATTNFLAAARAQDNTAHERAAMGYIEGKLAEVSGKFDPALDIYEEVASSTDRYYRALATRDRLELLHRLDQLDRENLIRGLERLRFAWRGGQFEFDLLTRLGDLYEAEEMYGKALRVWQQAAIYFEDEAGAEVATEKMRATFDKLFYDGLADKMPPIKAIALYDEFRELTPTGPKGDEMIRRLADRLVAVDLLPQAAKLLERQIKYRLSGADSARVGARLALLYLLDRQPSQAIQALLKTKAPTLRPSLERQRQQLMARALSEVGRHDEAIALLEGDDSRYAALLRADIHWSAEKWPEAAAALGKLVPEPARDLVLTNRQARMVLDWATALTLAQDDRGVANLRRRYMAAIAKTPFKDAFDLITATPEAGLIDYRSVADRIKQAEDFRSFLASYQDRLRADGLSAIN